MPVMTIVFIYRNCDLKVCSSSCYQNKKTILTASSQ